MKFVFFIFCRENSSWLSAINLNILTESLGTTLKSYFPVSQKTRGHTKIIITISDVLTVCIVSVVVEMQHYYGRFL